MKTFKKIETIQKPMLVIEYDDSVPSPREDTNRGYFITVDRNLNSPDQNEQLENIMRASGDETQNQEDHIQIMANLINTETNEQVIAIYPITKYEHSGISFSLGTTKGFDNSNNGFYIITDKTLKEFDEGLSKNTSGQKDVIQAELEEYNKWINGEVYRFTLYDNKGEEIDACGGFYDLEAVQQNLPVDWAKEDLNDYIIY